MNWPIAVLIAIALRILYKLEFTMPTIKEVKDAVAAAAAEVTLAVAGAIAKETAEISTQIQALKDQIAAGGTISQDDLDALVASVSGIGPAASSAIDAISTSDGA